MAVKNWNVGDVLTASDLNTWTVPLIGLKSSDQSITSQTTFVNDADLRFAVASNAVYEWRAYIRYDASTGGDIKFSTSNPTGSNSVYTILGNNLSGSFTGNSEFTGSGSVPRQGAGVGTLVTAIMNGYVDTASTAGTLILQWAQNTSSVNACTVHARSYIVGRRIG